MSEELVKRLRDEGSYYRVQEKHWCIDTEELERQRLAAADTIEAQAAEIAEYRRQHRSAVEIARPLLDALETQAAEIERLREALREMFEAVCGETGFAQAVRAESGFAYPWPALDIAEAMARAALGETK